MGVANPFSSQYAPPQQAFSPPVTSGIQYVPTQQVFSPPVTSGMAVPSTYGSAAFNPFASAAYTGTGPPTPPVPVRSAGQPQGTGMFDVFDGQEDFNRSPIAAAA